MDTARIEMVVFPLEPAQNFPRAVGRDVIDRMHTVAERGDVADRLLDEHILVMDEDDADDPRRYRSS